MLQRRNLKKIAFSNLVTIFFESHFHGVKIKNEQFMSFALAFLLKQLK
jgi:hypothetical protein